MKIIVLHNFRELLIDASCISCVMRVFVEVEVVLCIFMSELLLQVTQIVNYSLLLKHQAKLYTMYCRRLCLELVPPSLILASLKRE